MTVLSVNLNKIAWLRNARDGGNPDLLEAAAVAIAAGALGITVHPRPDQRHIRATDVFQLAEWLKRHPDIEFNIEGNPRAPANSGGYPGFDAFIEQTRPAQATLVPDSDDQLTSDHGWDLTGDTGDLAERIARYQDWGSRVSLFLDPVVEQVDLAKAVGADRIELYTGPYADAVSEHGVDSQQAAESLARYAAATARARSIGLGVNAGHDLDLTNLPLFMSIEGIDEVSIGHALISTALYQGMDTTVRAFVAALA
ncbi:MAG: pyridoxine 5'-phosphate synthase [Pseudomonadaceae bacterium]|nr:pyridoxine 5'-phosphate synthase [Pseudomonadaceae bacterium]